VSTATKIRWFYGKLLPSRTKIPMMAAVTDCSLTVGTCIRDSSSLYGFRFDVINLRVRIIHSSEEFSDRDMI
jgi:hypothetical protein